MTFSKIVILLEGVIRHTFRTPVVSVKNFPNTNLKPNPTYRKFKKIFDDLFLNPMSVLSIEMQVTKEKSDLTFVKSETENLMIVQ